MITSQVTKAPTKPARKALDIASLKIACCETTASTRVIGKAHGISHVAVQNHIKANGWARPTKPTEVSSAGVTSADLVTHTAEPQGTQTLIVQKVYRSDAHAMRTLDAIGIDAICDRIKDGERLTDIAAQLGVSRPSLFDWLTAEPARSACAREARSVAATMYDEQAQEAIQNAENPFEIVKARELATHLRWRASKVNPGFYGDKLQVASTTEIRTVTDAALLARAAALGLPVPAVQPESAGV